MRECHLFLCGKRNYRTEAGREEGYCSASTVFLLGGGEGGTKGRVLGVELGWQEEGWRLLA